MRHATLRSTNFGYHGMATEGAAPDKPGVTTYDIGGGDATTEVLNRRAAVSAAAHEGQID
ncbi:hypothetical protein MSEO_06870 [Mycobacterium seoulense]|uniref:Uncharacterized protein n=1 Tax=Mycobacterium seoulense TaxID=386911 RepID=A0A7I7NXC3_9MYCO|nr:hypothetical protein MSEO_06870 [Mycobacterium seoulense]